MHGHEHIFYSFVSDILASIPLIAFAALFVYLISQALKSKEKYQYHETPLDSLRRRYARGEITRDEFEQASKKLSE